MAFVKKLTRRRNLCKIYLKFCGLFVQYYFHLRFSREHSHIFIERRRPVVAFPHVESKVVAIRLFRELFRVIEKFRADALPAAIPVHAQVVYIQRFNAFHIVERHGRDNLAENVSLYFPVSGARDENGRVFVRHYTEQLFARVFGGAFYENIRSYFRVQVKHLFKQVEYSARVARLRSAYSRFHIFMRPLRRNVRFRFYPSI